MGAAEDILRALSDGSALCDDCLSDAAGIFPRQQVNQRCNEMSGSAVLRESATCRACGRVKLVNSSLAVGLRADLRDEPPASTPAGGSPAANAASRPKPLLYRTAAGAFGLSIDGESVVNAVGRRIPLDSAVWTEDPTGDPSLVTPECCRAAAVWADEAERAGAVEQAHAEARKRWEAEAPRREAEEAQRRATEEWELLKIRAWNSLRSLVRSITGR